MSGIRGACRAPRQEGTMIGPIFGLELRQDRSRGRRFSSCPGAYAGLLAFQVALSSWWGGGRPLVVGRQPSRPRPAPAPDPAPRAGQPALRPPAAADPGRDRHRLQRRAGQSGDPAGPAHHGVDLGRDRPGQAARPAAARAGGEPRRATDPRRRRQLRRPRPSSSPPSCSSPSWLPWGKSDSAPPGRHPCRQVPGVAYGHTTDAEIDLASMLIRDGTNLLFVRRDEGVQALR